MPTRRRRSATPWSSSRASADITRRVEVVRRISDDQSSIAGAVEERTATTAEMGRSVHVAAQGAGGIAAGIEVVGELGRRVGQFRV